MVKLTAMKTRPTIVRAIARRGRRNRSAQNGMQAAIKIGAAVEVTANQRNGCCVSWRYGITAHSGLLIAVLIIREKMTTTKTAIKLRLFCGANFLNISVSEGRI